MVAILYLLQNTEGDKSFLWHKQLNDDDNNNNNNNNNNNSNLYTGSSLHKEWYSVGPCKTIEKQ